MLFDRSSLESFIIYKRIPALDYAPFPCDAVIEDFISFVINLPKNTWIHFHCAHGKGRTSLFMALYDMLRNPNLSLNDIVYRHYYIGGQFLLNDGSSNSEEWKRDILLEKTLILPIFYDYCKDSSKLNYNLSYSDWKKKIYE